MRKLVLAISVILVTARIASSQVVTIYRTPVPMTCSSGQGITWNATTKLWECATLAAGSVTSVDFSAPGIFSVSGNPITTSGTIALALATQTANLIFAGPASGAAAAPTFRAVVDNDVPDTITLSNITQITTRSHTSLSDIGTNAHSVIDTFIASKAAASGLASLDAGSLVVQNPTNATATATASKIPIADASAKLDTWVTLGSSVDLASAEVTGILPVSKGGSGADLSGTGGANQFVKQSLLAGVFSVGAIADADVPDTITLSNLTQVTTRNISDTAGTLGPTRGGTGLSTFASGSFLRASALDTWAAASIVDADVPDTITLSNITQVTTRSHTSLSDIGTNTHAAVDTHIAATAAHGTTGAVVGTTDAQTLTNKTVDAASNTVSNIVNANVGAAAAIAYSKLAASTDVNTSGQVVDLTITGEVQGDVLYFNGTNWVRLAPGTSGWFLKTQGAAANPIWAATTAAADSVATKTGAYTATASDAFLLCDATTASFSITLYAASGNSGSKLHIKKIDSTANTCTIDANLSETIDGALTKVISGQWDSISIITNGISWFIY